MLNNNKFNVLWAPKCVSMCMYEKKNSAQNVPYGSQYSYKSIAECAKPDDNYRQHLHSNFSPSTAPLKPFISNIHQLIFYYILYFASAAILCDT